MRIFYGPLYLAVTCLVLVLPEVYRIMDCSGRSLQECFRILHSLVRQWNMFGEAFWKNFTLFSWFFYGR